MKVLDLFSGIGGFSLGLERAGFETIAFCEIDPFCQKVLSKHWPGVPIHDDIRGFDGAEYNGLVDIITAGPPCQPYSSAARGRNVHPDMWEHTADTIQAVRPAWAIVETVPGKKLEHVERMFCDLTKLRYNVRVADIEVAMRRHKRRRFWLVANAYGKSKSQCPVDEEMAGLSETAKRWRDQPEPVGVDDGLSGRMDRLRSLGNAIVPQIAEIIGHAIAGSRM